MIDDGSDLGLVGQQRESEAFAWIGTADGQELAVGGTLRPLEPPTVVEAGRPACQWCAFPIDPMAGSTFLVEQQDPGVRAEDKVAAVEQPELGRPAPARSPCVRTASRSRSAGFSRPRSGAALPKP